MLSCSFCIGIIILLIVASLWLRCAIYRSTNSEIKQSPLSIAIQELIAVAGGIYISLIMLISFLKLSVPNQITLTSQTDIDPLALLALVISILQPFVIKLVRRLKCHARK